MLCVCDDGFGVVVDYVVWCGCVDVWFDDLVFGDDWCQQCVVVLWVVLCMDDCVVWIDVYDCLFGVVECGLQWFDFLCDVVGELLVCV